MMRFGDNNLKATKEQTNKFMTNLIDELFEIYNLEALVKCKECKSIILRSNIAADDTSIFCYNCQTDLFRKEELK